MLHNPAMNAQSKKNDIKRGERIKHVRTDILSLRSQEQFAQWLSDKGHHVTRGAVGNWELGKDVGLDSLTAICENSGIQLDWLAHGKGPKLSGNRGGRGLISSYDPEAIDTADQEEHGYTREHWRPRIDGSLPEIDSKLGAGNGSVGEIINLPISGGSISGHRIVAEWLLPQSFLRDEIKASIGHTVVLEVIGDSMQPTYMPGDRVLVDLSQNALTSDTVYAISDGFSEPQIKRLQRVPFSNPAQVRIISDNPMLETFTAELSQLTVIGRVCGHIARK